VIWFCGESPGLDPASFPLPSYISHLAWSIATPTFPRITFAPGSSKGRGTRAAGWFADYIRAQNNTTMESSVLEGGIKGWVASGNEYVELTDGYDASIWKSS
jgi:hypothetical protein